MKDTLGVRLSRAERALQRIVRWADELAEYEEGACHGCSCTIQNRHYSDCPANAGDIARTALERNRR